VSVIEVKAQTQAKADMIEGFVAGNAEGGTSAQSTSPEHVIQAG
jgi:hypothetical protein